MNMPICNFKHAPLYNIQYIALFRLFFANHIKAKSSITQKISKNSRRPRTLPASRRQGYYQKESVYAIDRNLFYQRCLGRGFPRLLSGVFIEPTPLAVPLRAAIFIGWVSCTRKLFELVSSAHDTRKLYIRNSELDDGLERHNWKTRFRKGGPSSSRLLASLYLFGSVPRFWDTQSISPPQYYVY